MPVLAVVVALLLGGVVMLLTGVSIADASGRPTQRCSPGSFGSLYGDLGDADCRRAGDPCRARHGARLSRRAVQHRRRRPDDRSVAWRRSRWAFPFRGCRCSSTCRWRCSPARSSGAIWGAIPGWLKAATGAHEVITTIMLNLMAMQLTNYLLRNPPIQKPGRHDPISYSVLPSARAAEAVHLARPASAAQRRYPDRDPRRGF